MQEAHFAFAVVVVTASAALSAAFIVLLRPLLVRHLMAHPNERSSHVTATPEGAGIGVMISVFFVCGAAILWTGPAQPSLIPILAGAAVLAVVGGLDDAHSLAVSWRLLAQTLVALGVVLLLPSELRLLPQILPLGLERALLIVGVVGFVNAVNFLDGLDWMTVAQIVPLTLGVAVLSGLDVVPGSIGLLSLALLGATLGFAVFNKHPAKVFLGDVGSLPIGLVLVYLLIFVADAHMVSAVLLSLYTLADSTLTFARRLRDGEHVFSAHRSHFYQRAVAQGLPVPQVTARVFWLGLLLMTLAIATALARTWVMDLSALLLGLVGLVIVLVGFARGR